MYLNSDIISAIFIIYIIDSTKVFNHNVVYAFFYKLFKKYTEYIQIVFLMKFVGPEISETRFV